MQEMLSEHQKEILEANRSFYAAFEKLSTERMAEVWCRAADAMCIHPGRTAIVGYEDVMESWRLVFSATSYMEIDIREPVVYAGVDLGVVHCLESVMAVSGGQTNRGMIRASNVFRKEDDNWKILIHHGGPAGQ